ncbi:protein of unknown function [Enterobacter cancerogenus]|nr:protein of unknown function [Enterobacter cancerogenus]
MNSFVLMLQLHDFFLSCLYGSERAGCDGWIVAHFLSCLYGSELEENSLILLFKKNKSNIPACPPFFSIQITQP